MCAVTCENIAVLCRVPIYSMEISKLTLLLYMSFFHFLPDNVDVDDASQPDGAGNEEEEAAATVIQSAFRGYTAFGVLKELLLQKLTKAAIKIQSRFRNRKAKALLISRRLALVKIQSFFRKQKAKALLVSLRESKALAEASALVLVDAAEETKDNEGEYINITCSFMFNLLCIFTNLFFFHYFHTYQHLARKLVKQS